MSHSGPAEEGVEAQWIACAENGSSIYSSKATFSSPSPSSPVISTRKMPSSKGLICGGGSDFPLNVMHRFLTRLGPHKSIVAGNDRFRGSVADTTTRGAVDSSSLNFVEPEDEGREDGETEGTSGSG